MSIFAMLRLVYSFALMHVHIYRWNFRFSTLEETESPSLPTIQQLSNYSGYCGMSSQNGARNCIICGVLCPFLSSLKERRDSISPIITPRCSGGAVCTACQGVCLGRHGNQISYQMVPYLQQVSQDGHFWRRR